MSVALFVTLLASCADVSSPAGGTILFDSDGGDHEDAASVPMDAAITPSKDAADTVMDTSPAMDAALSDAPDAVFDAAQEADTEPANPYAHYTNRELSELRGAFVWDQHLGVLDSASLQDRMAEDIAISDEQKRRVAAGEWPTKAFEDPMYETKSNDDLNQMIIENNDWLRALDGRTSFTEAEKTGFGWASGGIYVLTVELLNRGAFIVVPGYVLDPDTVAALTS